MARSIRFNVGTADRMVRLVLGLLVLAAAFLLRDSMGVWGMAAGGVVGAVLMLTAAFRFCPAYLPLGLSTRSSPPTS